MKRAFFFILFSFNFFVFSIHAQKPEKIVNVIVESIRADSLSRSETYVGELEAFQTVEVKSLNEGVLEFLTNNQVGDVIRAKTILAKINTQRAFQNLRQSYINLENAVLAIVAQEKNYQTLLYGIQIAKEKYDLAESNYQRDKQLFEKEFLSEKDFNASENNYTTAKLQYELERQKLIIPESSTDEIPKFETFESYLRNPKTLNKLRLNIPKTTNFLALYNAHVHFNSSKINYTLAEKDYNDTIVRSPIGGVIMAKNAEADEFVNKGAEILQIAQLNPIKGIIFVRETELRDFPKGKNIQVRLDAFPNRKLQASIKQISPKADNQSRRFEIELSIKNPKQEYLPGMTVRADLIRTKPAKIIKIPISSLIQEPDLNFVYLLEKDRAKRVQVKIGEIINSKVEILSGLQEGQVIIVQGSQFLQDGGKVRVLNPI